MNKLGFYAVGQLEDLLDKWILELQDGLFQWDNPKYIALKGCIEDVKKLIEENENADR